MRRSVLGAALALALAGCIHVDVGGEEEGAPADRFHVIDAIETPPAPKGARAPSLGVRALRGRDRFGRHVVQREADGTVVALDHEYWADEPTTAVTDALREGLAASGAFDWVTDFTEASDTRFVLGGQVLDFSLDASRGAPAARARLRLTLSEGGTGRVLHSGAFEATEPLPGGSLPGLGAAMSKALSRCARDALAAWTPALAAVSTRGP